MLWSAMRLLYDENSDKGAHYSCRAIPPHAYLLHKTWPKHERPNPVTLFCRQAIKCSSRKV